MEQETTFKEGLRIYFSLVKNGYISAKEEEGLLYFSDARIREFVRMCATQSGTEILEAAENIHLVTAGSGSLFETPYHLLKEKIGFQNQDEFHLLCLIALVYLAEVDGNLVIRSSAERDGVSYTKLAKEVDRVLEDWQEKMKENSKWEEQWGINIKTAAELYLNKNLRDEKVSRLVPSFRTKWGIIHKIMTFLKEQKLVRFFESSDNVLVYPTDILYERLEFAYREDIRYENIKKMIHIAKGAL